MRYRAVLFDVGGPLDLEFAWEIAVDGAIASACGLEGIRVDSAMIDEASEAAVAAFAPDAYAHMVETLCGGDPQAIERVHQRVRAMVGNLDVFQLRPPFAGRRAGRRRDRCAGAGGRDHVTRVILSAAKDLMPLASGDEVLRCAQDDMN